MLSFKSANGYPVDLSLVHGSGDQIRTQFGASIKSSTDSATQLDLDFFSVGGTSLEILLSNTVSNRDKFLALPDGLYYVGVTYSPDASSNELKGYFYIQDYSLSTGDPISYADSLLSPASPTVTSGVAFDIYVEFRSSSLVRVTANIPSIDTMAISVSSPNNIPNPTIATRWQNGPVAGSYLASVTLGIADTATNLAISSGGNSLGVVTCVVVAGALAQMNGFGNTFNDFTVGSLQTYSFEPWDGSQNIIKEVFTWRS